MIDTQSNIPVKLQVELAAAIRGLDLTVIRKKLRIKPSLFTHAKSGARKKQFIRLIKYIEKFPVIEKQ